MNSAEGGLAPLAQPLSEEEQERLDAKFHNAIRTRRWVESKPCTSGYIVATWPKNKNALETKKVARAHEYWGG